LFREEGVMTIPQIKGPFRSILLIFGMALLGGVLNAKHHGEVRQLADYGEALQDSLMPALEVVGGWIFLRSPWAAEVQALKGTETKPEGK
jgi:hypothetical protein